MNKLITLATLVGSTTAFAPVNTQLSNSALHMSDARSPDGIGVDPDPIDLFDPLGFVDDVDSFARRHAVEIKHGCISIMGFIGMAIQELG